MCCLHGRIVEWTSLECSAAGTVLTLNVALVGFVGGTAIHGAIYDATGAASVGTCANCVLCFVFYLHQDLSVASSCPVAPATAAEGACRN